MNFSSIFSQLFGQAADHLPIDDPEVAQTVRMLSRVQMHLQTTWRQAQRMGIHCEQQVRSPSGDVLRCVEAMSSTCVACRRPVCLFHSAIVPDSGDLICFSCIGAAQRSAKERATARGATDYSSEPGSAKAKTQAVDESEKLRKKYLKLLKLTGQPTEEEIRSAFKKEAAKAHPDRVPPERRQKAHDKFVALGQARDWLLSDLRKKAA